MDCFPDVKSDKTIYRCTDTLETNFKFSNEHSNKSYFFKVNNKQEQISSDNEVNNFYILEHVGCHGNEDNRYTGLLNNTKLFPEIIDLLYSAIDETEDHSVSGKAIRKVPRFFWITHRHLPDVFTDHNYFYQRVQKDNGFKDEEIKELKKKVSKIKNRSVIFFNSNTLRNNGVHISRDISWERASQDYVRAFYSNPLMDEVREFSHIVTRFGVSGAIYSSGTREKEIGTDRRVHRVFFDPNAAHCGLYRDSGQHGDVIGYQSLFAACSILEVIKFKTDDIDFIQLIGTLGRGVRGSVRACQVFFDNGYGIHAKNNKEMAIKEIKECLEKIPDYLAKHITVLNNNLKIKYLTIANERIPIDSPNWSLLKQSAEYRLLDIAKELVYKDVHDVLNYQENPLESIAKKSMNSTVWAPVVIFDDGLVVVDRREIESYKAVHSLLISSMSSAPNKPLSIAVFGPPGSGKSFVVEKLIDSAKPAGTFIDYIVINMADISDLDALQSKIEEIKVREKELQVIPETENKSDSDAPQSKIEEIKDREKEPQVIPEIENISDLDAPHKAFKIPVILFDEFDCSLNGNDLVWLKSFLSLMEDWKKPNKDGRKKGSPILIFAGGTSHNYADFSREDSSLSEQQKANFAMAKGPDFVSRLRGHINILGPNRVDDDDDGHVIRRAIILRGILKEYSPDTPLEKVIHPAIVEAMLSVSSFKHGSRSMRAVINMCGKIGGSNGKIVSSTLPVLSQLNMHINGKEFLDLIIEKISNYSTPLKKN